MKECKTDRRAGKMRAYWKLCDECMGEVQSSLWVQALERSLHREDACYLLLPLPIQNNGGCSHCSIREVSVDWESLSQAYLWGHPSLEWREDMASWCLVFLSTEAYWGDKSNAYKYCILMHACSLFWCEWTCVSNSIFFNIFTSLLLIA